MAEQRNKLLRWMFGDITLWLVTLATMVVMTIAGSMLTTTATGKVDMGLYVNEGTKQSVSGAITPMNVLAYFGVQSVMLSPSDTGKGPGSAIIGQLKISYSKFWPILFLGLAAGAVIKLRRQRWLGVALTGPFTVISFLLVVYFWAIKYPYQNGLFQGYCYLGNGPELLFTIMVWVAAIGVAAGIVDWVIESGFGREVVRGGAQAFGTIKQSAAQLQTPRPTCSNCQAHLVAGAQFCHSCGMQNPLGSSFPAASGQIGPQPH